MKKNGIGLVAMCVAVMVMLASCTTTQKASAFTMDYLDKDIPAEKSLLVGVYNFVTEMSDTWAIYDARFISIDPVLEKYDFSGSFIVKLSSSSFWRYDFTSCLVQKSGNNFDVTFGQIGKYPVSAEGKRITYKSSLASELKQTTELVNSILGADKISDQERNNYVKQIKNEILMRMSNWDENDYADALNKTVTSPIIISAVSKNSDLVFSKFVEIYEVVGRQISLEIATTNVSENPNKNYKYYLSGDTFAGFERRNEITTPIFMGVSVSTNNDVALTIRPQDRFNVNLLNPPKESLYTASGTIKSVSKNSISIYE